jgi:invasion protein IalB
MSQFCGLASLLPPAYRGDENRMSHQKPGVRRHLHLLAATLALVLSGLAGPQAPAQPQPQPPAQQAPAPRQPFRTEVVRFDNWSVTCLEYAEGVPKKTCAAQVQVQQSGTTQIILVWTVSLNESKQFVSVLQTPTGISIGAGVELQPEKAGKRKLSYESCETSRCTATLTMDAALLREVTAAGTAQVVIYALTGQSVTFSFPIKGFDKASAHLRANS